MGIGAVGCAAGSFEGGTPIESDESRNRGEDPREELEHDPGLHAADMGFRSVVRDEAEREAREAAEYAAIRRALSDVARELMERGDLVSVACGHHSFTGRIVHTAADLAVVEMAGGQAVDVHLGGPVVLRVVERAVTGGRRGGGATSFRARLAEYRNAPRRREVVLGGPMLDPEGLVGVISAVARDHVVVHQSATGTEAYVPLALIAYAILQEESI